MLIWGRGELEAIRGDVQIMRGELRTVGNLINKGVFGARVSGVSEGVGLKRV